MDFYTERDYLLHDIQSTTVASEHYNYYSFCITYEESPSGFSVIYKGAFFRIDNCQTFNTAPDFWISEYVKANITTEQWVSTVNGAFRTQMITDEHGFDWVVAN